MDLKRVVLLVDLLVVGMVVYLVDLKDCCLVVVWVVALVALCNGIRIDRVRELGWLVSLEKKLLALPDGFVVGCTVG